MVSFPAALVVGIVGIIRDRRKILAIIIMIVAAGFVLFYLFCVVFISVIR